MKTDVHADLRSLQCHQVYTLSTINSEDRNADDREWVSLREGEGLPALILLRNQTPREGRGQDVWASCSPAQTKGSRGNTFQADLSRGFSVCSPGQIKSIISRNKWLWECEKMTGEETVSCFWKNWQPLQYFSANVLKHHSPIPALNQNFLSSTGLILHMHHLLPLYML